MMRQMRDLLRTMRDSTGPIVVGPWLSEVGFELLYWVPFVRWAQKQYRLDPERLIVVSRGGVRGWYAHITPNYLDVLSVITPHEYRDLNEARMREVAPRRSQKQFRIGAFDRLILDRLRDEVGAQPFLLHPSQMYALYCALRPGTLAGAGFARTQPFVPVAEAPVDLPDRYVAVRFYASSVFPATPENQAHVTRTVERIAETADVVVLEPGVSVDDHAEFVMPDHPRVHRIVEQVTPETNLGVQTQMLAWADRFVGTYGGYAYLPPLLGVPAETYYSDTERLHAMRGHLYEAQRLFASDPGYGALAVTCVEVACAA